MFGEECLKRAEGFLYRVEKWKDKIAQSSASGCRGSVFHLTSTFRLY